MALMRRSEMSKLRVTRKILSFLCCGAVSLGIIAAYPAATDNVQDVSAKTIAEIQEQRKANSEKIAALEGQINSLEGDKDNERAQQDYLNEQIGYIQENIDLLNAELESIGEDISATETNITNLDIDIENQQTEIDDNIELFKQRLCAMYVSSNETSASVILGSSSFYDMMSRVQMINRIAEYDDELINSILDEIDRLEQSKKDLETEKLSLEMKLEEQEKRKEEKAAEVENLNDKLRLTQAEIDRIAMEQQALERDKADIEAENAALAAEEAEIQAEIQRQAEAAQRAYEERQRQIAAEQAAAAAAAQQQQQQSSGGDSGSTYTPSEPVTYPVAPASSGFAWPVPGHSGITSYYGYRWGSLHAGIDISDGGIMGAAVCASQGGTVIRVNNSCSHNYAKSSSCGCGGGYGNYVVISHDGTYSTLYGHLTSAAVSVGEYVSQGQVIGYAGSTGWSTGAHLHFEVWVNGAKTDPTGYVSP